MIMRKLFWLSCCSLFNSFVVSAQLFNDILYSFAFVCVEAQEEIKKKLKYYLSKKESDPDLIALLLISVIRH